MPFDFHGQGRLLKKKGLSLNRMSRKSIPGRKLDKNLIMRLADCSYIDRKVLRSVMKAIVTNRLESGLFTSLQSNPSIPQ